MRNAEFAFDTIHDIDAPAADDQRWDAYRRAWCRAYVDLLELERVDPARRVRDVVVIAARIAFGLAAFTGGTTALFVMLVAAFGNSAGVTSGDIAGVVYGGLPDVWLQTCVTLLFVGPLCPISRIRLAFWTRLAPPAETRVLEQLQRWSLRYWAQAAGVRPGPLDLVSA